jgi:hypothetical protein
MKLVAIFFLLFGWQAHASINKELSAYTDHTSVSPASALEPWGFEIAAINGGTNTRELSTPFIGRLLGRLTFPHALTLEAGGSPDDSSTGLFVSQWSAALLWTFTDEVWIRQWFDAGLKLKYAHGRVVNDNVNFDDSIYGAEIFVSKKLNVLEPYLAAGLVKAKADPRSAQARMGVSFYLFPFLDLSAEYARSFDTDSFFFKIAFQMD